jgi:transketolase
MKLAEHLAPNLFEDAVAMVANRDGYGEGLKEAGASNPHVVALSADLVESTRTNLFADTYPERFLEVGIAEQNMASVASGMAAMGKVPFIASYAMFSPGRSWEQVRTTIAYNDANVKVIGAHAGVSVGPDGATHQAIEDIALMRTIPNMIVIAPADAEEAKKATLFAAAHVGPVYIRLSREKSPVITTPASPFQLGKGEVFMSRDPAHARTVGIVATGILTYQALTAAKTLNESGIGASVLHLATVKPLDTETLEAFSRDHELLITLEEHQIAGGMGSAVAEHLSLVSPTRILRLGVQDEFGQSGTPDELLAHYGMDANAVIAAARTALA